MNKFDLEDKIISYKMEGTAFDEGFDLYDTITSLSHFQSILDKAYLTIESKDRMSKSDREVFKIKATNIREGSFLTDFVIYSGAAIQLTYPLINTYSPSLLLSMTKEGFLYLRSVLKANKEGKKISINNTEGGDVMIINIEGDNQSPIIIGANTHHFASKAYDDIKQITSSVDGENIKNIGVFDKNNNKEIIQISNEDKEIFRVESKFEEVPTHIIGKIFRIDTRARTGKLIVIESEDPSLIERELNFDIMLEEDVDRCCAAINTEENYKVLRRIQYDPIKLVEQVKSLRIVRVS